MTSRDGSPLDSFDEHSARATELPAEPAAPDSPAPDTARRSWWPTVIILVSAATLGAVLLTETPGGNRWLPRCPLNQATGLLCPGCGGTRAAFALKHGEILRAIRCNALATIGIPLFVACAAWARWRYRLTGANWLTLLPARLMWTAAWVTIAFAVLRNVPVRPFVWLAP